MTCPICGSKSKVKDTGTDTDIIIRKRICLSDNCKYVFYTKEVDFNQTEAENLLYHLRKKVKK